MQCTQREERRMQPSEQHGKTTTPPPRIVQWFLVVAVIALFANGLGVLVVSRTFRAMGGVSEYAAAVRSRDVALGSIYNLIVFPGMTAVVIWYMWPVLVFAWRRPRGAAPLQVQRRLVGIPLMVALLGFGPWFFGCLLFPLETIYRFGRWSPELMSQQVLSPLVSGFLAATTTYLLLDWLVRARLVPRLLPGTRITEVKGALALGVYARMLVFLLAVAFTPLFTMLGLVRAAVVRLGAGVPPEQEIPVLAHAGNTAFVAYVLLGVGLTLVLARTLTRPLGEVVAALRRVQAGDLSAGVEVTSSDELGVLQDGVNTMIAALRDKEHILQTFGRVVEPAIRDQLLRGDLQLGGELRSASVLFCDLRGFTSFAEQAPPEQVVATLNQFFTTMTAWVRECGGFVDKFIGDAMLVVFGLFDRDGDGAQAASAAGALRCALGMRERLAVLNATRQAAGQAALAVAVSIHSGEVLSGTIGAADRHEYTVIGDTVNVAARLQQLCKEQGRDLLFSETTYDLARAYGLAFDVTLRDFVSLRGRREPVRVFGVA
jgi:adenylate cyclase